MSATESDSHRRSDRWRLDLQDRRSRFTNQDIDPSLTEAIQSLLDITGTQSSNHSYSPTTTPLRSSHKSYHQSVPVLSYQGRLDNISLENRPVDDLKLKKPSIVARRNVALESSESATELPTHHYVRYDDIGEEVACSPCELSSLVSDDRGAVFSSHDDTCSTRDFNGSSLNLGNGDATVLSRHEPARDNTHPTVETDVKQAVSDVECPQKAGNDGWVHRVDRSIQNCVNATDQSHYEGTKNDEGKHNHVNLDFEEVPMAEEEDTNIDSPFDSTFESIIDCELENAGFQCATSSSETYETDERGGECYGENHNRDALNRRRLANETSGRSKFPKPTGTEVSASIERAKAKRRRRRTVSQSGSSVEVCARKRSLSGGSECGSHRHSADLDGAGKCYAEQHYGTIMAHMRGRHDPLMASYTSLASNQSTWYIDLAMSSSGDRDSDAASLASSTCPPSETTPHPDKYGFIGGAQYTQDGKENIPVNVIRKRESKWLEMLNRWDFFMMKKYDKVRDRCRKGIPSAIRARAWQHLCGADRVLENSPGVFERLSAAPLDPRTEDEIRKDLHRQFPLHEMFLRRGGQGQEDLFTVLKVHSLVCGDGYCQAHAPVAAVLLMQMPAEHAFWCLRAICDKYLPGYYSHGLEAIQMDGLILYKLVKKVSPSVYKILKKQKIDPVLYMTEWFMCLYSRTLPWASVLRVWDMFFCEGVKVLFRVGLVLLKFGLRQEVRANCPSMYETLQALRNIAPGIMAEDFLLMQLGRLDISEEDLQKEHMRQSNKKEQERIQKEKQDQKTKER